MRGKKKSERIALGLELLAAAARPAKRLTWADIAAWCECEPATIQKIEEGALRRLRNRVRFGGAAPVFRELAGSQVVKNTGGVEYRACPPREAAYLLA